MLGSLRSLGGLFLLTAAACAAPQAAPTPTPGPATVASHDDAPRHFLNEHGTGALLMDLARDRTYRVIAREHMGLFVQDSGRWKSGSDEVLLCSDSEFRRVEHAPLSIWVRNAEACEALPALRDQIQAWLVTHEGSALPPTEVTRIGAHGNLEPLSWMPLSKAVPRADLEGLVVALARYI